VKPNARAAKYRLAVIAATLIAFSPLVVHTASPAPLVAASREVESTVPVALVHAHSPLSVDGDAQALADDVNRERAKRGRAALTRDAALDRFALAKAVDMATHAYFGHTSLEGVTFQDRMSALHWPTSYVGENIAFDRDEPAAHLAFVNSPPHFANLLDPNERRIGVAVVTVGIGETFYVEDFSR
jgi:uncharacterized protein YkwD